MVGAGSRSCRPRYASSWGVSAAYAREAVAENYVALTRGRAPGPCGRARSAGGDDPGSDPHPVCSRAWNFEPGSVRNTTDWCVTWRGHVPAGELGPVVLSADMGTPGGAPATVSTEDVSHADPSDVVIEVSALRMSYGGVEAV